MAQLKDLIVNGNSRLIGDSTAQTPESSSNNQEIATTAFVKTAIDAAIIGARQEKDITMPISNATQTVTPDTGKVLSKVTVKPMDSATITSGAGIASATTEVAPGTVSVAKVTGGNVSAGDATTATPTTGYYVATKATAAANTTGATSSISGTVAAPSVGTAGYVSSTAGTKNTNTVSGTATAKTSVKDSATTYIPITAGALSAADSTISGGSFTPTLTYNSTNDNFAFGGSANATGTAYAKVSTTGYVDSSKNTSKTLSAAVSATGTVAKVGTGATITGTTTKQPAISRQAFTISGVTDAASGAATTTAPTSGVYVKVKSAANTGTLTATPKVTSAGYGTTAAYGATAATATVGASASADTYVPIKQGSATGNAGTITYKSHTQDTTNTKKFTVTGTVTAPAPSVTPGYVSSGTAGTSVDRTVSLTITDAQAQAAVGSGSVTSSDNTLSVSPSVTPTAHASAAGNISLGAATVSAPTSGYYILATGGNNETTGSATPGESSTITKTAGYISAGSFAITSTAAAKANASSKTVYYPVTAGAITINTSGGTSSGTITAGSQIKIGSGYYGSDAYYTAASNPTLSGDATEGNVLSGKKFYSNSYTQKTGTMTNNGAVSPSGLNCGGSYTIPAGYHNGSGKVIANSLASQTGVDSGKTAVTAGAMLSGYQGWVNGSKISGTIGNGAITNNTSGGTSSGTINRGRQIKIGAGYYGSDAYYTAQANSGNLALVGTSAATISCDGYSTVSTCNADINTNNITVSSATTAVNIVASGGLIPATSISAITVPSGTSLTVNVEGTINSLSGSGFVTTPSSQTLSNYLNSGTINTLTNYSQINTLTTGGTIASILNTGTLTAITNNGAIGSIQSVGTNQSSIGTTVSGLLNFDSTATITKSFSTVYASSATDVSSLNLVANSSGTNKRGCWMVSPDFIYPKYQLSTGHSGIRYFSIQSSVAWSAAYQVWTDGSVSSSPGVSSCTAAGGRKNFGSSVSLANVGNYGATISVFGTFTPGSTVKIAFETAYTTTSATQYTYTVTGYCDMVTFTCKRMNSTSSSIEILASEHINSRCVGKNITTISSDENGNIIFEEED